MYQRTTTETSHRGSFIPQTNLTKTTTKKQQQQQTHTHTNEIFHANQTFICLDPHQKYG